MEAEVTISAGTWILYLRHCYDQLMISLCPEYVGIMCLHSWEAEDSGLLRHDYHQKGDGLMIE